MVGTESKEVDVFCNICQKKGTGEEMLFYSKVCVVHVGTFSLFKFKRSEKPTFQFANLDLCETCKERSLDEVVKLMDYDYTDSVNYTFQKIKDMK